jgi:hypothetical protein
MTNKCVCTKATNIRMHHNPLSEKRLISITITITHQGLIGICIASKLSMKLHYLNLYQLILIPIAGCIVCKHWLLYNQDSQYLLHLTLPEEPINLWLLFYIAIAYITMTLIYLHLFILTHILTSDVLWIK